MKADASGRVPGLSAYWRIDSSDDRSREMASVIGGASSQAELVQTRLRQSRHSARHDSIAPVIVDPKLLSGFTAPVPVAVVDCLVGLAIREAAFRELYADSSNWQHWGELSDEERREFSRVHRALEDVFISARLNRISMVLGHYLVAMRSMLAPGMPSGDVLDMVTRDIVLELWLGVTLYVRSAPISAGVIESIARVSSSRFWR